MDSSRLRLRRQGLSLYCHNRSVRPPSLLFLSERYRKKAKDFGLESLKINHRGHREHGERLIVIGFASFLAYLTAT
jgi:hypothetical protein